MDANGSSATSLWTREGASELIPIHEILGLRKASNYDGPTQEVDGTIRCINTSIKFSHVISDPNNAGKKFILSSLTRNEKEQAYDVTMLEILSEDLSEVYRVNEDGEIREIENSSKGWNYNPRILES